MILFMAATFKIQIWNIFIGGGSHKPSSAPTKNRLRSQSPLTQLTDKQAKANKTGGGTKAQQDYYK